MTDDESVDVTSDDDALRTEYGTEDVRDPLFDLTQNDGLNEDVTQVTGSLINANDGLVSDQDEDGSDAGIDDLLSEGEERGHKSNVSPSNLM